MSTTSSLQAAWYRNISELPLDRFERCLFQSDLSALTIAGNPSLEDLSEAWSNIYYQFIDKSQGNNKNYSLLLEKEIILLKDEIDQTEGALLLLGQMMEFMSNETEMVAPVLRKWGHDYPFDPKEPEVFYSNMERISNSLANKKYKLETKEKDLADHKKSVEKNTIETDYFKKWLITIARFRQVVVIRSKEITVEEFILMLTEYLDYVRINNKELDHGRKR